MYSLPREKTGTSPVFPERHLNPSDNTQKLKNGTLQGNLQFIHLRNLANLEPAEQIKMKNYSNYQSVCLSQNLDDIAKDVLDLKEHIKRLH